MPTPDADARRWGWHWVIAPVDPDGAVHVLDPARARSGREIRLGPDAAIDHLLRWIDERRAADRPGAAPPVTRRARRPRRPAP